MIILPFDVLIQINQSAGQLSRRVDDRRVALLDGGGNEARR